MDEELLIELLKNAFLGGFLCECGEDFDFELDAYIKQIRYEYPQLFKSDCQ